VSIRLAGILLGLACGAAGAEPHFAVHPLETAGVSAADAERMGALFDVLVAKTPKIKLAGAARMDEALATNAASGCDVRDSCLRFLAESTDSLYGIYVRLDLEGEELIATSRVVRLDGVLVRQARIAVPVSGKPIDVAHQALTLTLAELKLNELDSTLPARQAVPEPIVLTPPPVPPAAIEPTTGWKKIAGWTLIAAGGTTLAAGGVFAGLSAAGLAANPHDPRGLVSPEHAAPAASALNQARIATGLIPVGAAVAAVGAILLLTPASAPQLSVVPLQDGAALSFSGTLR
jgi:hypothetical protein